MSMRIKSTSIIIQTCKQVQIKTKGCTDLPYRVTLLLRTFFLFHKHASHMNVKKCSKSCIQFKNPNNFFFFLFYVELNWPFRNQYIINDGKKSFLQSILLFSQIDLSTIPAEIMFILGVNQVPAMLPMFTQSVLKSRRISNLQIRLSKCLIYVSV